MPGCGHLPAQHLFKHSEELRFAVRPAQVGIDSIRRVLVLCKIHLRPTVGGHDHRQIGQSRLLARKGRKLQAPRARCAFSMEDCRIHAHSVEAKDPDGLCRISGLDQCNTLPLEQPCNRLGDLGTRMEQEQFHPTCVSERPVPKLTPLF